MGFLDNLIKDNKANVEQENEDKKICAFVKNKVEDVRSTQNRISSEGVWLTNISYLLGYSGLFFDTQARSFRPINSNVNSLKRNRIHVNKILPRFQHRLARLAKSRPKFQARPESSDTDDKEAARLAEQVLDVLWQKEEMSKKTLDLFGWTGEAGHAYLKISWDDTLGNEIMDPTTGETQYEGDIRVDVVSPFEVFPDPLAKTFDECAYIIQAKVRKLDYFKAQYPGKGDLVKEEGAWLLSTQYEQRINSINTNGAGDSGVSSQTKNTAIELVYYEKRSKKHPNGRMIIVANNIKLEDKELPAGEIPFFKFDDIPISGKYYSECVITHARPIQDQYNRVITARAQWTNKLLAGKYIAARGSELIQEAINDQSGEVVEYTPVPNALPPTAMQLPVIPSYAYKEEEQLELILDDIFGINEVSRGVLPSASSSAIALQFLAEQDDTRIGVITRRNELTFAKFGGILLKYVEAFYQTPRLLKISGKNLEYTVKSFVGADLKGNTDVIVVEGSTNPTSITAKQERVLGILQTGLLGNPQDPKVAEKVLSMIEFGNINDIWLDYGLDMAQIKDVIELLEAGGAPEMNEFDNHALFLQELNRYRKTDKFKALDPDKQTNFMAYMEAHLQAETQLQNPQLQQDHVDVQGLQNQLQSESQGLGGAAPGGQSLDMQSQGQPQGGV